VLGLYFARSPLRNSYFGTLAETSMQHDARSKEHRAPDTRD
jgi:hypothetical protein